MKKLGIDRIFYIIISIAILSMGCGGKNVREEYTTTAYKSLRTAAISYDTLMLAANDLREQGLLSNSVKLQIIEAGTDFWGAYHSAVDLLSLYARTGDAMDKEQYEMMWSEAVCFIEDLRMHLRPFMKEVR